MSSLATVESFPKITCEIGVDRHFTKMEWELICPNSWSKIEYLTKVPLHKFISLAFYKSLKQPGKRYVNYLLLYQRVVWSLDDVLSVRFFSLPLEQIHNFIWMEEKVEKHYVALDIKNEQTKRKFKLDIMTLTFRIWAAGYGLLKGEGRKYVDHDFLMILKTNIEKRHHSRKRTVLKKLSLILEKEKESPVTVPIITCEVGVDRHFTRIEWDLICSNSWSRIEYLTKIPLEKFSNLAFYTSLKGPEKRYVNYLLLYQRVVLSLDDALSFRFFLLPLEKIQNFAWLDDKLEKYSDELLKLDNKNDYKKNRLKINVITLVFRIWAAGYGLYRGEGRECVDDGILNILKEHFGKSSDKYRRVILTKLSLILEKEKESPVTGRIDVRRVPKSKIDLEKDGWDVIINEYHNELAENIYEFIFNYLLSQVKDLDIRTVYQKGTQSNKIRRAIRPITIATWTKWSAEMRGYVKLFYGFGLNSSSDLISGGLEKILIHVSRKWVRKKIGNFRSLIKRWLMYYIERYDLNLNVNTIIPHSMKRKTTQFGKILNLGNAYTLIEALLDEQSPFINENDVLEFRCRRVCLIQLATGSRVTAICLLLKDCITTDHYGNKWMQLHKTKNGKPQVVKATEDVQNWVEQSSKFAPKDKVFSPKNDRYFGDGLTEYRLFANTSEVATLTSNQIGKFLTKIQKRLWPDMPKEEYFTSHDFRRMHAIYMVMKKKSKHEIQDQLGHSGPNSLIPYLATSSPEIQQYYSEIYKEGIWGNVVNKLEEPTDLELDPLLEQAAKVVQAEDKEQFISSLLEKFKGEEVEFGFSNDASFMPINNVSAGFPRFTHNCVAHEMLNCGHTELHCFKCDYYKPDDDKYNEHIAEIFRFMLLALRGEDMAKSKRDTIQKELVSIRSHDIIELIDESFPKLLEKKFLITSREIPKLKNGLWDKAKSYWKKYKKTKPILTFEEALHYLKEGKLEWVGKEASQ
ncbi:tyrosine-type recombinase/integrase [Paenibacillus chondroitinus]|uniref:Tyrosine-type recombinase/integrase n=1 Tax=Paenibacillus chondroitinus TaxID=59842 RepID=A0ABU6D9N2_9BACL|nr:MULTISPECIES: tyrosine-type recombinase/integrase [Paenibacillus]MCY9661967.1 site-specific integrase [Paenibacillus anseongense]MEB4793653.1 tyrosine-type recombinase/integrase [Paenibacillus chondroitinus]